MNQGVQEAIDYQTRQPMRYLKRGDLPLFLEGWLSRFYLSERAAQIATDGEAFIFVGLADFWDEPGPPFVLQADLSMMLTGRLEQVMRKVFQCAAKQGRLNDITNASGDARRRLVTALRIED